jgi:hypothetical protein
MSSEQSTQRVPEVSVAHFREPDPNPRHEALRKDIAARLRKSCSHLSDAQFEALVEKMLKVQLNGERRFGSHHMKAT